MEICDLVCHSQLKSQGWTHMHVCLCLSEKLNGWIGLKAASNKDLYKWEDGTDVSFTYWGRAQPPLLAPNTDTCVTSMEAVCGCDVVQF